MSRPRYRQIVVSSALICLFMATGAGFLKAAPDGQPTVLLELFTSQGCSSCPPADRLLAKLAQEETISGVRIIPLAFHVDYWNYIGWQDPFSSEAWSNRQRAYATAMGLETIYTPQIFLNGQTQIVGGDEREVRREILKIASESQAVDLTLDVLELTDDTLRLAVSAAFPTSGLTSRTLGMVALFQDELKTEVSAGENARRSLENERVVRALLAVLELSAGSTVTATEIVEIPLEADWPVEDLGVVFFLQDPRSMRIVQASAVRLAASQADAR
jgi:hypothetical protein